MTRSDLPKLTLPKLTLPKLTLAALVLLIVCACLIGTPSAEAREKQRVDYAGDVASACDQIAKACKHLLTSKKIDWKKVTKAFEKEAKSITSHEEHLALLLRLVARLQDGHAAVRKTKHTQEVPYPDQGRKLAGPGMFWCRVGTKLYVKNSWSGAKRVGIEPGMEVVKVNGRAASKWLDLRLAYLRDRIGFSTDQHALHFALAWGLAEVVGTRMDVHLKDRKGKTRKRTVAYERAGFAASGPAFPPKGLQGDRDVTYGTTARGFGYIHYRRCKSSITHRTDDALKALGRVKGLILDFRANGGGGFDHEGLLGRFIPAGKSLSFAKRYASQGEAPYGGPIVVIVDGVTRSAGETASGMFKEDGRAYMIGESPTAGMSSSKRTLDLPSGLFQLYVSVRSNMGRFNKSKGIEGVGVVPHEIVAFVPEDLAQGEDTLIKRAEEILAEGAGSSLFKKNVAYVPERFGWKAP